MILSAAFPVFAEDEGADPSLIAEKVTYLEDEPKSDVEGIWYSYLDTKNQAYGWEFPYSDSFFRTGSIQPEDGAGFSWFGAQRFQEFDRVA